MSGRSEGGRGNYLRCGMWVREITGQGAEGRKCFAYICNPLKTRSHVTDCCANLTLSTRGHSFCLRARECAVYVSLENATSGQLLVNWIIIHGIDDVYMRTVGLVLLVQV